MIAASAVSISVEMFVVGLTPLEQIASASGGLVGFARSSAGAWTRSGRRSQGQQGLL
jgi:hypothetical protein